MARSCTVCTHPKHKQIDRDLIGHVDTYRNLAQRYNVHLRSLYRHYCEHLTKELARADNAQQLESNNLYGELQNLYTKITKIAEACDRYLTDPEDPSRYNIGARAEDIEVIYEIGTNGNRCRVKTVLSDLIDRVETGGNLFVSNTRAKYADPRKLILDAAGQAHKFLDLYARLVGELQTQEAARVVNNIVIVPGKMEPEEWSKWAREQLPSQQSVGNRNPNSISR